MLLGQLVVRKALAFLEQPVGLDDLQRVGSGDEHLGEERVRVKRDRRHELVERVGGEEGLGIERVGAQRRLEITRVGSLCIEQRLEIGRVGLLGRGVARQAGRRNQDGRHGHRALQPQHCVPLQAGHGPIWI